MLVGQCDSVLVCQCECADDRNILLGVKRFVNNKRCNYSKNLQGRRQNKFNVQVEQRIAPTVRFATPSQKTCFACQRAIEGREQRKHDAL